MINLGMGLGMSEGKYSVPQHIRDQKPKGSMVKRIRDNFYVYEYKTVYVDGIKKE